MNDGMMVDADNGTFVERIEPGAFGPIDGDVARRRIYHDGQSFRVLRDTWERCEDGTVVRVIHEAEFGGGRDP